MRNSGNGNAAVCANNLVRISRGEVPFDRIRGVKFAEIAGKTIAENDDLADDIEWMVKTYEPRVSVDSVKIVIDDAENGQATVTVNVNGGK